MSDYENLAKYSLALHGDSREQEWARDVLPKFPAYQEFWRWYIVPLTNRVDSRLSRSENQQLWIDLREGVSKGHERMAMHHYSVFYYLARAAGRIRSATTEFPEDIFSVLDACGDNVRAFFESMRSILNDFGKSVDFLPTQKNEFCSDEDLTRRPSERGAFVEVQSYRDTILHNPVLGHALSGSARLLPRRELLDDVKTSWRRCALLRPEDRIDSRELYLRLLDEVMQFLQERWAKIIRTLDAVREGEKFGRQWSLDERLLPLAPPQEIGSTAQPLAASGVWIQAPAYSPTASATMAPANRRKSEES